MSLYTTKMTIWDYVKAKRQAEQKRWRLVEHDDCWAVEHKCKRFRAWRTERSCGSREVAENYLRANATLDEDCKPVFPAYASLPTFYFPRCLAADELSERIAWRGSVLGASTAAISFAIAKTSYLALTLITDYQIDELFYYLGQLEAMQVNFNSINWVGLPPSEVAKFSANYPYELHQCPH